MRRMLAIMLVLSVAGLGWLAAEAQPPPDKGRPGDLTAVSLETDEFLKAPAGLPLDGFTVARAAPRVDVCVLTDLPDKGKGTLWSSWGDGCLAKNGKYYTSVGDHLGINATSYVYEYDPVALTLR